MQFTRTHPEAQGILERILRAKRSEVARLQPRAADLRHQVADADPVRGFAAALRRAGEVRLIAEIKRRSPSAGEIRPGADPATVAWDYERAGAAALSVLTDAEFFGGDLDALRRARAATSLPALRKDFVVDALQIWEARAAGADAVLLIVRALSQSELRDLMALAGELGLDALVEAHDEAEIDRALDAGARLLGINHRDLDTLRIDPELTVRMAPRIPPEITLVGESGIHTGADVDRLGAAGVDAILVGESLMRQPDIAAAASALVGRPRQNRVT